MATITFKAKVEDHSIYGKVIKLPEFKKAHCDMPSFRTHPRHGGLANSDLFPALLNSRIKREIFGESAYLKLSDIPAGVQVDDSKFLAVVTVTV